MTMIMRITWYCNLLFAHCTCWMRAGWPPLSDRSQYRDPGGRWRGVCKHTSSSDIHPASCLPVKSIEPWVTVTECIGNVTLEWHSSQVECRNIFNYKSSLAWFRWVLLKSTIPWTCSWCWPAPCWSAWSPPPCSCSSWCRRWRPRGLACHRHEQRASLSIYTSWKRKLYCNIILLWPQNINPIIRTVSHT